MNISKIALSVIILVIYTMVSCKPSIQAELPYLGRPKLIDGVEMKHKIRSIDYIDQDSSVFNNQTFVGKVHIADFFFTSCPSICPKVMQQMLRIQKKYEDDDRVMLVSYSLDPKRDTPARLKKFAQSIGANEKMWKFVHGPKDSIMTIANEDYYVPAYEDENAPGGFDHSGKLLLIDGDGHLRAFAEGTEQESVTEFFDDIDNILSQMK